MFKDAKPTEAEQLRDTLVDPNTRIRIVGANGKVWELLNDTLLRCDLVVTDVYVKDTEDVSTTFVVNSLNGRLL